MLFVARNGETEKLYLVEAADVDAAREALADAEDSDGDPFALAPAVMPDGNKVLDITEQLV